MGHDLVHFPSPSAQDCLRRCHARWFHLHQPGNPPGCPAGTPCCWFKHGALAHTGGGRGEPDLCPRVAPAAESRAAATVVGRVWPAGERAGHHRLPGPRACAAARSKAPARRRAGRARRPPNVFALQRYPMRRDRRARPPPPLMIRIRRFTSTASMVQTARRGPWAPRPAPPGGRSRCPAACLAR